MRVLSLIDSFKGTISSKELGKIMTNTLKENNIEADYFSIADGGDGFLIALENLIKTERVNIKVNDPLGRMINSYYLANDNTAYIEMAKASGINLLKKAELTPYKANTYGFGQMIKDSINKGFKTIVLGIGGSATNDGGVGMLEALGASFYNNNTPLVDIQPKQLDLINRIEVNSLYENIKNFKFIVLNDVTNPLLGVKGATYIYGPQKGVNNKDLIILEKKMNSYAKVVTKTIQKDEREYPGSGAAGGVGFALKSFFECRFIPGINYILKLINFEKLAKTYDYIITGEGKIDNQSLDGKVISGILDIVDKDKVIMVCAINELGNKDNIFSIVEKIATLDESLNDPINSYKKLCKDVSSFLSEQK